MSAPASVLYDLRRWAHYDLVKQPGRTKPAKIPTRKVNAPASWMTHAEALATMGRHAGLAFLLGDGWAGIDIDGIAQDEDKLAPTIIEACDGAYVEPSISGNGLHVIGRSERMGFEIDFSKDAAVTLWTTARFFVFTGKGEGNPTVDITEVIDILAPTKQEAPQLTSDKRGYAFAANMTDEALLHQMRGADNGAKFIALFEDGDLTAYGNDPSRADLALASMLLFWCDGDVARVDRFFRASALYDVRARLQREKNIRPKWNVASYREATLRRAMFRSVGGAA